MSSLAVLMYHGLHDGPEELARIPGEERPYAVSARHFREHLLTIRDCGAHVLTHSEMGDPAALAAAGRQVLITFDDGDKGWIRHALPALREFGMEGTFFVASGLIEHRPHFCGWPDVEALAEAGMNIQSHGQTHRFLPGLSEDECRREFADSRRTLERVTGRLVTEFSFPGGRFRMRDVGIGRSEGFRVFHTSRPGLNPLSGQSGLFRRFAVRSTTTAEQLRRTVTAHRPTVARLVLMAALKESARSLLGSAGYHRLYEAVRGGQDNRRGNG